LTQNSQLQFDQYDSRGQGTNPKESRRGGRKRKVGTKKNDKKETKEGKERKNTVKPSRRYDKTRLTSKEKKRHKGTEEWDLSGMGGVRKAQGSRGGKWAWGDFGRGMGTHQQRKEKTKK